MDPFGWPVPLISGPDGGDPSGYGAGSHLPPPHHTQLDLHMGQAPHYQYYRKHGAEELMAQPAQNPRLQPNHWGSIQHSFGTDQQWRQNADGSIMEMRKEKSRDAARSRRGKENFEFYELAKMLPLPPAITSQLDKASIIRLTISYLRLREFTKSGDPPWMGSQANAHKTLKGLRGRHPSCSPVELFELHHGFHIVQALDGFTFILAADGRFLYISETVSIYLGLSQVEMAGSSVFEYVHQEDHKELAEQLELTLTSSTPSLSSSSLTASSSPSSLASDDGAPSSGSNPLGTMNPDVKTPMTLGPSSVHKGFDRAFCIRMKSTLTKRGCHFKSSGYRVLLVLGHLRPQQLTYSQHQSSPKAPPSLMGLVAVAIALPSPSMNELKLEPDMFVSKINFDFRLAHCEPKVSDLLHYSPEELLGRSLYSLCHAQDVQILRKTHTDLLKKGQVMSPYYRILNKTGGYVWVQTCATVICNSKNNDDQNIICVNYVLSAPLDPSIILDHHQLDPSLGGVKTDTSSADYTAPHTPDKTASDSPSCVGVGSPGAPSTPGRSGSGGPQRSPLPVHLQDTGLHEPHNVGLHDPHDSHTTLQNQHDIQESLNDPHKDLRSNSHMDQDPHIMSNEPHIPHGAPLTPQLTPVSQMGGTMTPIVSSEGECIKTETGPVLTPLSGAQEHLEDPHRNHKLSPLALHGHLHYTSVPSHTQLSPVSNNRYSPISNTQLSPSSVYSAMEKVPHQDMDGSVRQLEAVMTRHLPQDGSGQVGLGGGQQQGGFSAIQWAGGQENPSAIIRQIYSTKRETVIRTSRDPHDVSSSPPCPTAPNSTSAIITNLPPTSTGAMTVNTAYPAYHISPPSSVSPDRLKAMPCGDPYQDIYNTPVYTNNPVPPKNPYDGLRWYPA